MQPGLLTAIQTPTDNGLAGDLLASCEDVSPDVSPSFLPEMETALSSRIVNASMGGVEGNDTSSISMNLWTRLKVGLAPRRPSMIQLALGRAALAQLAIPLAEQVQISAEGAEASLVESSAGKIMPDSAMANRAWRATKLGTSEQDEQNGDGSDSGLAAVGIAPGGDPSRNRSISVLSEGFGFALPDTLLTSITGDYQSNEESAPAGIPLSGPGSPIGTGDRLNLSTGQKVRITIPGPPAGAMMCSGNPAGGAVAKDPAYNDAFVARRVMSAAAAAFLRAASGTDTEIDHVPAETGSTIELNGEQHDWSPISFEAIVRAGTGSGKSDGPAGLPETPYGVANSGGRGPSGKRPSEPGRAIWDGGKDWDRDFRRELKVAGQTETASAEMGVGREAASDFKQSVMPGPAREAERHQTFESSVPAGSASGSLNASDGVQPEEGAVEQPARAEWPFADAGNAEAASPVRELDVKVQATGGSAVHLRFNTRNGEVHLTARTADAELSRELALGLPHLKRRLLDAGMQADLWPQPDQINQVENKSELETRAEGDSGRGDRSHAEQDGRQHSSAGRDRAKWSDLIEDSLDGEGKGGIR